MKMVAVRYRLQLSN